MNPHGSRRQLEGCFRTTSRDALQSIPSGDLLVAAQHPTPNTQHPTPPGRPCRTPNAQHPTPWRPPNAPKMNLRGSLRQREGCFRTTYRGASQSIPSGDLVVAAGRGIQRLTPNTQRPPTPSKRMLPSKRPTPGRPCRPSRVAKIQACHSSLPPAQASVPKLAPRKAPSSPRGDPAFRVEQEMKGRRPKRPPFNQIRLPLQARAGNRPTN